MRVLVTGATGQLGRHVVRELEQRNWDHVDWCGSQAVDLTDRDRTAAAFRAARPTCIFHTAALSSVADCFRDPARATAVNTAGTALLAELATETGARLVFTSTDLVFDGANPPYRETDDPNPLSVYGRTKSAAEEAVCQHPNGLVVRVSLLFGPNHGGRPSFFDQQKAAIRSGNRFPLFADEWRTPLGLETAAAALADLAAEDVTGVLHLGGPERMSRLEMGRRLAAFLGRSDDCLAAVQRNDAAAPEPRPCDVSLDSSRWRGLFPTAAWPTFEEALREMRVT